MKTIELKVTDPAGMHARPASILSKEASRYESEIHILCGDKKSNMKSIMGILSMGILTNSQITITVEGNDEDIALNSLKVIIEDTKIAG